MNEGVIEMGNFRNQPNVKNCTDCARCIAGSRDYGQMGLEQLRISPFSRILGHKRSLKI